MEDSQTWSQFFRLKPDPWDRWDTERHEWLPDYANWDPIVRPSNRTRNPDWDENADRSKAEMTRRWTRWKVGFYPDPVLCQIKIRDVFLNCVVHYYMILNNLLNIKKITDACILSVNKQQLLSSLSCHSNGIVFEWVLTNILRLKN